MRIHIVCLLALGGVLAGCAHGMQHGAMSHDEMMRHCQEMEQHQAQGAHDAAEHDPAAHGGMTHDEMMRHCAAMRADDPSTSQHQH